VNNIILDLAEPEVALSHLALYGLGAILEESGHDVRLSWTARMRSRPCLHATEPGDQWLGAAVRTHAAHHASDTSWVSRNIRLSGAERGLMSPRLSTFGDRQTWTQVQHDRHDVLDQLTGQRRRLDLRMLAALGEPAYWSTNDKGEIQQDDGASRWEMQPRNRGSEFVGNRLRPLATAIAAREPATIAAGLTGSSTSGVADSIPARLTYPVGLAASGPFDPALVWCALWGISQLPLAPRTSTGRRARAAITTGHIGRSRNEWFYAPLWHQPWRPARLRSILASAQLRTAASSGLPLRDRERPSDSAVAAARSWLAARGVVGVVRFPIQRFGSDNAPERRAMRGAFLPVER
jgi:CRISPR-associated protein Csb3